MRLSQPIPAPYVPGELNTISFIRAGEGWDFHQGPVLHQFASGHLGMYWWGYDVQECSNQGVVLASASKDQGQTWEAPQLWMCSPNAVVSHLQFSQVRNTDDVLMVYREGHFYGAREDRQRRATLKWASYGESPMHLLAKRSTDAGYTWAPPAEIDPQIVVGRDAPPFYGAPEQLLQLSNGDLLMLVTYLDPDQRQPQHFNISALRSTDGGLTWEKTGDWTVPEQRGAMEPSVAETEPGELFGVIRNKSGFLYEVRGHAYGAEWDTPQRTRIPAVESMARVLLLASGRLMLTWNNQSSITQHPRHPLAAALSADAGHSWSGARILADEVSLNQLSNFNQIQCDDGRILVCTSHYRATPPACSDLDLLVFDEDWLVS